MRRAPRESTRRETEEQSISRRPFRSWCPCCIAAKAEHWLHRRVQDAEGAEEALPSAHMDHRFMENDEVDEDATVINNKDATLRNTR